MSGRKRLPAGAKNRLTRFFGNQKITTKVYMMAPANRDAIALDVVDYMWEEERHRFVQAGQ